MKLLTLNCHSWQEENQIEKIQYLAKVIQEEEYDVIALQEVSQSIQAENVCGNKKKIILTFTIRRVKSATCKRLQYYLGFLSYWL